MPESLHAIRPNYHARHEVSHAYMLSVYAPRAGVGKLVEAFWHVKIAGFSTQREIGNPFDERAHQLESVQDTRPYLWDRSA